MKAFKHYIEETRGGNWEWTHVTLGGFLPSRGPKETTSGQILLTKANHEGNNYTIDSKYDRRFIAPRPGWALGLILIGFLALASSAQFAAFLIGALLFAGVGLLAIAVGVLSYQKSLHIYALFCEGEKFQIPFIRQFASIQVIKEIIDTTSRQSAEGAMAKKISEFLHPDIPWGLIIAAAIAGLGGGAVIGVLAATVHP